MLQFLRITRWNMQALFRERLCGPCGRAARVIHIAGCPVTLTRSRRRAVSSCRSCSSSLSSRRSGRARSGTAVAPTPADPAGTIATQTPIPRRWPRPEPAVAEQAAAGAVTPDRGPTRCPGGAPPIARLTGYRWPIAHGRGSRSRSGRRRGASGSSTASPVHDGIDLATFCGDKIVAAHDGTVLAAGRHFDDHSAGSATFARTTRGSTRRSCG